ncbi:unnamed protein product [Adineta steineri]|uniref:Tubby C-terminal domain-containing protein n=1 Tax=Adineta steineri TaxID=433720 RepID=A0A815T1R2_9BILA|nr:unnamed protein product [Adineta steineri]CAF1497242.1 unnamed protein product [Adineta steineri]CAF3633636.1 unnamed protein product [Adineta steineri]CAF4111726.1 unnamed protein product [Adineta steineri]
MLRDITSNPWQIDNSDSEDEIDQRLYRRFSFSQSLPTPTLLTRQSLPRMADWDPIVIERRHKRTFGRRKTAPSYENTPADNKPIFYGTRDLKSSHSVLVRNQRNKPMIATTFDTPPASPPTVTLDFNPMLYLQENLNSFIYTHIPKDHPSFIHCSLRRDKTGLQKGFFPTYYLHLERPTDGKKTLILAARKVAKVNRQNEYVISTNIETLSNKSGGDGCVGKLRECHLTGGQYTLYDNGLSAHKLRNKHPETQKTLRRELAGIIYNSNMFGLKGSKQMNVLIPKLEHAVQPIKNEDTIIGQWREQKFNHLLQLRNQPPKHDETTNVHLLQFEGNRPIRPSTKNFNIVLETENHQEEVVMQFGRIDEDTFTCDYRYPLSAIQAFSIALSSFDRRLARE